MNIYALIGSVILILFLIKREKDEHDTNKKYKNTWKEFFMSNWDDFALAILSGQLIVRIQESVYFGVVRYMDWDYDKYLDLYFDAEDAISFVIGFSGTFLIGWLYKVLMKKINKDVEV